MFFPDKQSILGSEPPETTEESTMLPLFSLMSERGPVEHSKLPLFQTFSEPIQCTDPPSTVRQVLPLCWSCFLKRALTGNHTPDPTCSAMQDLPLV